MKSLVINPTTGAVQDVQQLTSYRTAITIPNATTTNATIYTVSAAPAGADAFLLSAVVIRLTTAIVGAGSCVVSVGATAGGQEYLLNVTLTSGTAVGVVAGASLLSLGASMVAANGFEALLAAGGTVVCRLVTTGAITAGAVQTSVIGMPL